MTTHHTTLGFEIEFTRAANLDAVLANIRQSGVDGNKPALANVVDERHSYHTTFFTDRWVQGYDMSCGWEIKSHPLRDTSEVRDVMSGIRIGGGRVTNACGLHVHVGIAHLTAAQIRRLCKVYARYEPALDLLLPRSRRGRTEYASSNYTTIASISGRSGSSLITHFADLDNALGVPALRGIANPNGKFSKFNLGPYESKTTVEFRGHQGTLNFRKIDSWASLLVAMIKMAEGSEEIEPRVATFNMMVNELVGTEREAADSPRRPAEGTKGAQIWSAMDRLLNADGDRADLASSLFANDSNSANGIRVIHGNAAGYLMVELGFAQGTVRTAITRWAQSKGMTRRPSDSRTGLRTYLNRRREALAAR